MTIEERMTGFYVRIVDTNDQFVKLNEKDIEHILFINSATEALFKVSVAKGFKKIKIGPKREMFINYSQTDMKFLFLYHNWIMVEDIKEKILLLYKIE